MPKVAIVIPSSHSWFWLQTCIASLKRFPVDAQIIVVNNAPWATASRCITETALGEGVTVLPNEKVNKFHASALDYVVANSGNEYVKDFDYLMAWETDVLALAPDWLDWYLNQMKSTDYVVGAWHHEQFVNPSCTLYRASVLREMLSWCRKIEEPVLRWGDKFERESPLDDNIPRHMTEVIAHIVSWMCGPFAERRGWPAGTVLKERPSGQDKGPGHYEPGQALHHWAVEQGYTYTVCPNWTHNREAGFPLQTVYGVTDGPAKQMEFGELAMPGAKTAHMWGGTRALEIIKHEVNDQFLIDNRKFYLSREARFWLDSVPKDVQARTLDLLRKYGWYLQPYGTATFTERNYEAARIVEKDYRDAGIPI